MSVGMASFEGPLGELDAFDVARRGGELIWEARYRVWPYLLLMAAVITGARWLAWRYGVPMGDDYSYRGESLAEFGRHGAWVSGRALAVGLAAGLTLRSLLGVASPWRPDRGLLGFTAIYVGAAMIPILLFLPTVLAWLSGGMLAIPLVIATGLGGFCGLLAFAWFALRLVIWPVGVAAGDPGMTAARAWQQMPGARLAWLMAGVLLVLPLLFGAALARGIVQSVTGAWGWGAGPWEAPIHALVVLLWLAVSVVVYRRRAGPEG
jgi:hypothetical protein